MRRVSALIFALTICLPLFAQFNQDLDATKGRRKASSRDDQIWHPEAANVSYKRAGNVSLTTASRYGLTENWELSTYLAFDFFQPNVMAKYRWTRHPKFWYLSSKINIGNAYPGLKFAQKHGYESFATSEDTLPVVGEFGHELILSRAISSDVNCSDGSIWLILTASLGTYWGIEMRSGTLGLIPYHFLANRSEVLTNRGFLASLKLWADWKATNWLLVHGGMRFHNRSLERNFAFELQAEAEVFVIPEFSARVGGALSLANYPGVDKKVGGVPIVDLTYYFGKRKSKERDLFNPNGRLY